MTPLPPERQAFYEQGIALCSTGSLVLDAGFGDALGALLLAQDSRPAHVYAIDDNLTPIALHPKLSLQQKKLSFDKTLFNISFDLVLSWHALAACADDITALSNLNEILKPGGQLLIGVPNEQIAPFATARNPGFFRHYTSSQAEELLTQSGFLIKQSLAYEGDHLIAEHSPRTAVYVCTKRQECR